MPKVSTYTEITDPTADKVLYVDDPARMTLGSLSKLMKSLLNQHFHSWAVDLDGTDGLCTLGSQAAITGTAYTFSWWAEFDATGDVLFGRTADSNCFVWYPSATSLFHKCNSSSTNNVQFSIDSVASGIHHFVLRRNGDGNDFDLFQNGAKRASPSYSGTVPNNAFTPNLIGDSSAGGLDFNGRVWLIQAWDSALTDAQCQDLYNYIFPASAVLDLRFTEGNGTAVKDFSASGNDGTLSGGYSWASRPV